MVFTCVACGVISYGINRLLYEGKIVTGPPVEVEILPSLPTEQSVLPETVEEIPPSPPPLPGSSTLVTLLNEEIPINDPLNLAQRLEGKEDIPRTVPVENLDRKVGDRETFWVMNVDTDEHFQIEANLAAVSDHLYFWIEEGVEYSKKPLNRLVADFEEKIYPINRDFFGSEWTPGIDEDPHIYVIYASGLGETLAGYFSSIDEYHYLVHEYSNAHETFMMNADTAGLEEQYTYGVLAHEFQHMIHWYRDPNETSWLNEGFAELATLLTGYRQGPSHDYFYAEDPDSQLNDWPNDPNNPQATFPHYGSSFLFVAYFQDRFGNEATKALVADQGNGLPSIDKILGELKTIDPFTGEIFNADDVFLDWVITNYIKDLYNVTDRFKYSNYPVAPEFLPTESIDHCPTGVQDRDVHQYGVDYLEFTCEGTYTLRFKGQQSVQVLPKNPFSGSFAFWSNKGDTSDMHLTRDFDFREVSGPLTLTYWTWYDLEKDFDYMYLEISANGGDWQIIQAPSTTSEDPTGNSYGWGYTGLSGDEGEWGEWIQEIVDLSAYAGQQIQIRFEYITDAAVHGEGFMLDDIAIPELGYFEDFEEDEGGWQSDGFVRIENLLPQTYRLALIFLDKVPKIQYIYIPQNNEIELPISIGGEGANEVILVVTGTTRFTRQVAEYQFQILEK